MSDDVAREQRPLTCSESVDEVRASPEVGDLLVFDGLEWRVSRRKGWHYLVIDRSPNAFWRNSGYSPDSDG